MWTPYVLQDKTKQENSCHLPAPGSSRSKRNLWLSFSGCKENAIITTLEGGGELHQRHFGLTLDGGQFTFNQTIKDLEDPKFGGLRWGCQLVFVRLPDLPVTVAGTETEASTLPRLFRIRVSWE